MLTCYLCDLYDMRLFLWWTVQPSDVCSFSNALLWGILIYPTVWPSPTPSMRKLTKWGFYWRNSLQWVFISYYLVPELTWLHTSLSLVRYLSWPLHNYDPDTFSFYLSSLTIPPQLPLSLVLLLILLPPCSSFVSSLALLSQPCPTQPGSWLIVMIVAALCHCSSTFSHDS